MVEIMPTLSIHLHEVKRSLLSHLGAHAKEINAEFERQVNLFCTPENMERLLQEAVSKEIPAAIEASVKAYFYYGDGRNAVREAIEDRLRSIFAKETP